MAIEFENMNRPPLIYSAELLSKQEDLHEDLIPFLDTNGNQMFHTLRHPLIYLVPYVPAYNALLNKRYEVMSEKIKKYLQDKKYDSYIFMHERPYRLQAFLDINILLDNKDYWELLCDIWVDSENIWQNLNIWKKLLKRRSNSKHLFMSESDKKHFDNLPDQFVVYRGYTIGKNKTGLSYTTDEIKAKWFAKRFDKNGEVRSRRIDKKDVFAYTNKRSEMEIILLK